MERIRQGDIPGVQLRRRVVAPGSSPEAVWPYWVEIAKQSLWLCDRSRQEEGSSEVFRLETDLTGATVRREHFEIVERSEPLRLIMGLRELDAGWTGATKLTVELGQSETGCNVGVFQEGFQQLPLSLGLTAWESARVRWRLALDRLVELVLPNESA